VGHKHLLNTQLNDLLAFVASFPVSSALCSKLVVHFRVLRFQSPRDDANDVFGTNECGDDFDAQ